VAFVAFMAQAVFLSLSGVMAPGPVTAVTVAEGSKSPSAGAIVAVGHGLVEFPLMVVVFYGFEYVFSSSQFKGIVGLVGGILLLYLAYGMIRSIRASDAGVAAAIRSPLAAGAILSVSSPYFLLWWATVGATLLIGAYKFGVAGVLVFAILHWLCDLIWFYFLSAVSFKSGKFFGNKFQQIIFAVCGVFLVFLGGKFIIDAIGILS
jgi:threonine/homoserine/homoserine lactone efflux protein